LIIQNNLRRAIRKKACECGVAVARLGLRLTAKGPPLPGFRFETSAEDLEQEEGVDF